VRSRSGHLLGPSGGRDRNDRGGGRSDRLRCTQQAYASSKASDDRTRASELTVEEMITRLTSQIIALQARISDSSSGAQSYHSHSLSLLLPSLVIKYVNVLRGLATKTGVDKTWIVDSGASHPRFYCV
jgi:hypothetical protein